MCVCVYLFYKYILIGRQLQIMLLTPTPITLLVRASGRKILVSSSTARERCGTNSMLNNFDIENRETMVNKRIKWIGCDYLSKVSNSPSKLQESEEF